MQTWYRILIMTQIINMRITAILGLILLLGFQACEEVSTKFETEENLPYENFSYTILERKKEEEKVIEQKSSIPGDSKAEGERPVDEKNRYTPAYSPDGSFLVYGESQCPGGRNYASSCDADADPSDPRLPSGQRFELVDKRNVARRPTGPTVFA